MVDDTIDDVIEHEIKAWSQEHSSISHLVTLQKINTDQDGVRNIVFLLDNSQEFSLRCPANYPDYQDDNFFVEATSSLQLWTNALNEYLLDSSGRLNETYKSIHQFLPLAFISIPLILLSNHYNI